MQLFLNCVSLNRFIAVAVVKRLMSRACLNKLHSEANLGTFTYVHRDTHQTASSTLTIAGVSDEMWQDAIENTYAM
jgi:hypothetical protein